MGQDMFAAAGAGAVAIADAVVVVVRIFCVEGRSWHGARSVGDEWAKTAGGTRRVGDSGETKSESRGRVAITARAIVLNKVFIIVVTCLEGEDAGVRVVRISGDSGEGVEPTHHPLAGAK